LFIQHPTRASSSCAEDPGLRNGAQDQGPRRRSDHGHRCGPGADVGGAPATLVEGDAVALNLGLRATGYGSQVKCYRLWVTGYGLQVTGYGLRVTGYYGLQVTGYYGLQVMGYRLRVTGYGLWVTGYLLRNTGNRPQVLLDPSPLSF